MDTVERLLVAELTSLEAEPRVDDELVLAGVASRQRRRRLVTSAIAVGAVVAAGVTGTSLVAVRQAVPPAPGVSPTVTRPPTPEKSTMDWMGAVSGTPVSPIVGSFADPQHGFLLAMRCGTVESRYLPCNAQLEVTADGGRSWVGRPLPAQPGDMSIDTIFAVDARTVVYSRTETGHLELPDRRFVSTDAGQSWREVRVVTIAETHEVPAGAQVAVAWSEHGPEVIVVRPDGGSAALTPLPAQPDLGEVTTTAAGDIFLAGRRDTFDPGDSGTGTTEADIYVSHDRGHTWQRIAAPVVHQTGSAGYTADSHLATADGRVLYYADGYAEGFAPITTTLFRSLDGGRSWGRVSLPHAGAGADLDTLTMQLNGYSSLGGEGVDTFFSMAPLADGGLLLTTGGHLFRLRPSDATPREVHTPYGRFVIPLGDGRVVGVGIQGSDRDHVNVFGLTRDGTSWSAMTFS